MRVMLPLLCQRNAYAAACFTTSQLHQDMHDLEVNLVMYRVCCVQQYCTALLAPGKIVLFLAALLHTSQE